MIRRKGGYDKAIHAMEKLSSVGLLDCLVTTMTKHNIKQMAHPAMLAEKYKARMLVYHNLVPVGRAGENMEELAPTADQYEEAFNEIYDIQRKLYGTVKVNVYSPFYARIVRQKNPTDFWQWYNEGYLGKCTIGGNYIGITENGDYRSCGFHEGYRVGNVKDKKLSTAWAELQKSELHLKLRDKSNLKGQMRSLRIPRNLRRMQNTSRILHRRPLRIRPSMQLHTQSPTRRPQSTRSTTQKPNGKSTINQLNFFTQFNPLF